jgi:vacuolar-type H+-ATPase subunit H
VLQLARFSRLDWAGISPDNREYMTDRLTGIVDAVRQRVEDELRQQLSTLTAEHERALDEALREAAQTSERQSQDAETRWAALLQEAREGSRQMVESAVAAARAEFESERKTALASASGWWARVSGALDDAGSLTDVLNRLADIVGREAGGVVLVVRRGVLERWPMRTSGSMSEAWTAVANEAVRIRAVRTEAGVTAVPVLIDRTAVAVLVAADDGGRGRLEQLSLVAAGRLATLTATRLVQAERWLSGPRQAMISTR